MRRLLMLAGRLILAGIFIYAAWAKLKEPWLQFAVSIDSFKIVPDKFLEPMAIWLPRFEMALGIALLSGFAVRWFGLTAALLLGTFWAAAMRAYSMGLSPDCGCFGSGGNSDMLGPKWFAEHGAMVLLAVLVAFGDRIRFRARSSGPEAELVPAGD